MLFDLIFSEKEGTCSKHKHTFRIKNSTTFCVACKAKVSHKNSSREKLYSLTLKIKLETLPYSLLNQLRELGFFLYLLIGYYKRIDIVLHEKLLVNFQELKRIYLINIKKKYIVHVIRVRCSTKEDNPAG